MYACNHIRKNNNSNNNTLNCIAPYVWDSAVWKKDEIELILLKCLKWLKAGLHFLWNTYELSKTKHLRRHKFKLVKHISHLEVRRQFFTERLINRWNSLDQQSLDVDSVNCFKNHLQRLRNTRMGFFVN